MEYSFGLLENEMERGMPVGYVAKEIDESCSLKMCRYLSAHNGSLISMFKYKIAFLNYGEKNSDRWKNCTQNSKDWRVHRKSRSYLTSASE